jgi:hypothetical protein
VIISTVVDVGLGDRIKVCDGVELGGTEGVMVKAGALVGASVRLGEGAVLERTSCVGVYVGPGSWIIAGDHFQKIMASKPITKPTMINRQFILRKPGGGGSMISGCMGWLSALLSIFSKLGGGVYDGWGAQIFNSS